MSAHIIRPQTIIDDLPEEDIELSVEELMVIVGGMLPVTVTGCKPPYSDKDRTGTNCDV